MWLFWRDAMRDGGIDPEVQAQIEQMGQALQEMGQRLQEAEGKRDLEAQKLAIESYKAETERMTALSPAMGPEEIQALVLQTLQQLSTPNDLPNEEGADGPTAMMAEPESMPAY
jgi:beta-phosphoglucomutase-like phosphatase (HAD superfamily)